jgi:hypothetical protein
MTFGTDKVVTVSTAGKIGLVVFDVTAGQRPALKITGGTADLSYISILDPYGRAVGAAGVGSNAVLIGPTRAPVNSTYTIRVDPALTFTGSATLRLYDVPSDVSGTVVAGGAAIPFAVSVPGQNGHWTFSGTSGQRVSALATGSTFDAMYLSIVNPDGTPLAGPAGFIDALALPTTGTYSVFADPLGPATGSATVTLYDVPADAAATLTAGSSAATLAITGPGQNGKYRFSGTSGQRVSLYINGGPLSTLTLRKPDGSTLTTGSVGIFASFVEPLVLPATGTYSIDVDPLGASTGNVTVTLYDVPADVSGTVTIGGNSLSVGITTPGQNGSVTFSGSSGQQATVWLTSNTLGWTTVKLLKPDGTQLTSSLSWGTSFNLSTVSLPTTGTYTIVVDPDGAATGSISVNVTNP